MVLIEMLGANSAVASLTCSNNGALGGFQVGNLSILQCNVASNLDADFPFSMYFLIFCFVFLALVLMLGTVLKLSN